MSRVQMLRAMVEQRLTAAVEEIFELFERMIAEYEEEVSHSKQENDRQQKLLDAVLNPDIQLHRADVQQLLVSKEKVPPEQQQWSPSLDQENPEPLHIKEKQENPEPPHIKEEQEEIWISHEGEQLQGLEEADITKFAFTPGSVKSEDEEEEPQASHLHQSQSEENRGSEPLASTSSEWMKTEADGDCGGSEPPSNQLLSSHRFEPETDDSDDNSVETSEPQSGLDTLKNNEVLGGHMGPHTGEKRFSCPGCAKGFNEKGNMQRHMRSHTGERPFSCSFCGGKYLRKEVLERHMRVHTGERPFSCSVCGKTTLRKDDLKRHMRVHTGEKPFSCSVCNTSFSLKKTLVEHMRVHTGEKPFVCSVCSKSFSRSREMVLHMRVHTGEKPFICSVCNKGFSMKKTLVRHMRVHTGEKPYSCSFCNKSFSQKKTLVRHTRVHTGE